MMKTNNKPRQRGLALIGAVSFTLVVLALGLGVTSMATYERKSTQTAADIIVGRNVAEAGADLAMWQLKQDPTWRCANSPAAFTNTALTATVAGQTVTLGRYTVKPLTTNPDGTVSISSDGLGNGFNNSNGGKTKTIELVAYPAGASSVFVAGLVGRESLEVTGSDDDGDNDSDDIGDDDREHGDGDIEHSDDDRDSEHSDDDRDREHSDDDRDSDHGDGRTDGRAGSCGMDSYKSANGAYGGCNVGSHGDIRTDSTAAGSVKFTGRRTINGAVVVGRGGIPSSVVSDGSSVTVARGKSSACSSLEWPKIKSPCGSTNIGSITCSRTLGPGKYTCDKIELAGNEKLTCNGDVELVVTGKCHFTESAGIETNGSLKTYCHDDWDDEGCGVTNNTGVPKNFQIYGMPTCSSVKIHGNSKASCATYAPDAEITVTGNKSVCGSVVGKTIRYTSSAPFHYDESLDDHRSDTGNLGFKTRSWQEDG